MLAIAACFLSACNETPFEPLSALPFALATNSCGPADGPTVVVYLAAQSFELPQPVAPYVQIQLATSANVMKAGDVFPIEDDVLGTNAWFHGSGVETSAATNGEVGITEFTSNTVSGYVDLKFAGGQKFRGTFISAWQTRQLLCG
jgi:hypothetical protein